MSAFTFWEGPKPGYIELCHRALSLHNPGFRVWDYASLKEEITQLQFFLEDPYFHQLCLAHQADIIRVKMLEHHKESRCWIDSDFICLHTLDTLVKLARREHKFFYYKDSWVPTNGIIVAPLHHSLVLEWSRKIDVVYANLKRNEVIPDTGGTWTSFGAAQLKVLLPIALEPTQDLGWDRVQLIRYEEMARFFMKQQLKDNIWPGCYGYMLFNTGFPGWFKRLSAKEILDGPWLISLLFRIALRLEDCREYNMCPVELGHPAN